MLLVNPSVEIVAITDDALRLIESAGRTCYKSEAKMTNESSKTFVTSLLKRGHESVLEHASMTARIVCDRGVTHEIVRHRIASYSQESTRYCDYSGDVAFVIPPWVNVHSGVYEKTSLCRANVDSASLAWVEHMLAVEESYKYLRAVGWKPEQARSVLPNSLKTEIIMTANFREWRHFFFLRVAPAAHPQMRQVATMILEEALKKVDVVFNDFLAAKV